jgi:hypothetical protein
MNTNQEEPKTEEQLKREQEIRDYVEKYGPDADL